MSKRVPRGLTVLLCLGGLFGANGCGEPAPPAAPPAPEATVATPLVRTVQGYRDFTGRTEAIERADIRARVSGYLDSVEFEASSMVEEGQLLFTIEPDLYEAEVDAARANLARAEAAREQAQWELERIEQAAEQGGARPQELELARAKLAVMEADVEVAESRVRKAELDLSYTKVRSPIAGQVGRNLVDRGNLVGAGEATLLTTVVRMDPIYVYFDVPEVFMLSFLRARAEQRSAAGGGHRIFLSLEDERGFPHEGRVDYVDNTVDAATGTVEVRGVFPNPKGLIYPGLFARVRVPARVVEDAVLIEERAVGTDLAGKYVLVVGDEDVVSRRGVELAGKFGGWRLVAEGLEPGERYIVEGLMRARPGMPVRAQEQPADDPARPEEPPVVIEQSATNASDEG